MSRMDEILRVWRTEYRIPFALSAQETWDFWLLESPTYDVKVNAVLEYANTFSLRTLIETGTYQGAMIESTKQHFERIYSIELEKSLYLNAAKHFAPDRHVKIILGDSAQKLPPLLSTIHTPCLFWLDGHYIPLSTEAAKGDRDTPILQELDVILNHSVPNHVILVDDARCFIGKNPLLKDYPTIAELKDYVQQKRPDMQFTVKNDIIRIHLP